ncbi:hypothetical protein RHSIM_Rhsim03G0227900 [Rhododendron simsii]|uniref:F-box/LRR-repeat protein 15-like leucin rich repeat domain-containing protein n=1 Tax=Rhododendron simsii TaxID=118357 RepID=A0A834H9R6_RHOSS|nr:hypothetical protein RHSIM_Rhsim03G0227900 [Rhododendron simsii]
MTVLRSRKILSPPPPKIPKMKAPIEPTTPAKTLELSSLGSIASTPAHRGLGSDSASVLPPSRRSLRLVSVHNVNEVNPSSVTVSNRKRKVGVVAANSVEDKSECGLLANVVGIDEKPRVTDVGVRKVRVWNGNMVKGDLDFETGEGRDEVVMVDEVTTGVIGSTRDLKSFGEVRGNGVSDEKGEGERTLGNVGGLRTLELVYEDCSDKGILRLRSGKKVTKRIVEGSVGFKNVGVDEEPWVSNIRGKKVRVSDRVGMRSIVAGELDLETEEGREEVVSKVDEDTKSEIGSTCVRGNGVSDEKGARKRKLGNVVDLRNLGLVSEDCSDKGILSLRSGKKVTKRIVEGSGGDVGKLVHANNWEGGMVNKSQGYLGVVLDNVEVKLGCKVEIPVGIGLDEDRIGDDNGSGTDARRRLGGEKKGKGKVFNDDLVPSQNDVLGPADMAEHIAVKEEKESTADRDPAVKSRRRLSRQEKGKGKVVEDGLLSNGIPVVGLELEPNMGESTKIAVLGTHSLVDDVSIIDGQQVTETNIRANVVQGRDPKARFRDIAKKNASRFAHFSSKEVEENGSIDEVEREMPGMEAEWDSEDWPGPFSTAMKIIRDREMNMNVLPQNSCSDKSKPASMVWVPKKDHNRDSPKMLIPSLQDLCLAILAKNADAITSLDSVPDMLRHRLSKMLCDSRKMNGHFLDLLVHGSPTEIRIRECSCLTEEQLMTAFEGCEPSKLTVLQLDLCGRCMPDYILKATLARSPNSLPALTTISLNGAYRLLDAGLSALVMSAPALRSISLSQCSLLTSDGIKIIADSLGSVLRELYIDNCENIDAVLILPALLKLEHLEVLSLAGIETVCDDFIGKFVAVRGHHIKELVLTDCKKLTDASSKVIADNCKGLCALDLGNLHRLTDSTMGYLANGCRAIQSLKLCRNSFSDEAIAAYLEASGEALEDLSLYRINKVSYNTAVSLARCSAKLLSLDLSGCRNLPDEALGLIVDSCLSLKVLKLFGCTQITNVFLDGHSNPHVQIIGLETPILENLKVPDFLGGPLHYSS